MALETAAKSAVREYPTVRQCPPLTDRVTHAGEFVKLAHQSEISPLYSRLVLVGHLHREQGGRPAYVRSFCPTRIQIRPLHMAQSDTLVSTSSVRNARMDHTHSQTRSKLPRVTPVPTTVPMASPTESPAVQNRLRDTI